MTERFDAVVVGAGPGGSRAAMRLARSGCRTLLLEKGRLGRDKPCGGGLTPRSYHSLDVPLDGLVLSRVASADLRHGPARSLRVDLTGRAVLMVLRRDLDRRLTEAAAAAGAAVHDAEPATAVETEGPTLRVRSRRGDYSADIVLVATGAEAPLRGAAGIAPPARTMAVALELEGPAESDRLDGSSFVFDYAVPGGYAWAFPKGSWWNVGILSGLPEQGPSLRRRLAGFMAETGVRFHDGRLTAETATGRRIPMWGGRRRIEAGRVALVGDAAGLADPLFGEGIAQALWSGEIAATAALSVLSGRAPDMRGYSEAVDRVLGRHLRRTRQAARVLYAMPAVSIAALSRVGVARRAATHVATETFRAGGDGRARPRRSRRGEPGPEGGAG